MAALVMMLVGPPLMLNGFYADQRARAARAGKGDHRDTFHNLRQNKPLFIVLLSFFFCVFHNVAGRLYIYFFINNLGDGSLQDGDWRDGDSGGGVVRGRPNADAPDAKRKLFMILCGLDVAVRVVMVHRLSASDDAVHSARPESTLFVMMTNILTSSMIADTIEYAEYH